MYLTWLDSNSWLIEIENLNILLDPWLVEPLIFGNLPWLIKGEKKPIQIPEKIDLILLSQGLEDHAHPPTLKTLDHQIPVIASPKGAKVVKELGFQEIHSLSHHEDFTYLDLIKIKAFPGSPVGPTLIENGYLITDLTKQKNLYYEPHGYHDPKVKNEAPVNIIIAPIIDLTLPLLGAVIKGQKSALELCQWLKPDVILPTATGGDVKFEGLLVNLLKEKGTIDDFRNLLTENNLATKVLNPPPGVKIEL